MRLRPIEAWETTAGRLALEAFAVAALCALFLWPFRLYGFDLVDEGTQLAQIERVAAGERPYIDFETGYTPVYFALQSWLFERGEDTIVAIRTFGVLWQGVLVGGLWAIVRAWAGPAIACATAVLYVAFFLPMSLRLGAPFNIPYPGWLAAPAALAVQVMVSRVSARRIRRRDIVLLASGVCAGFAFSVKPNSGLLVLAGAALALSPAWSPARAVDRVVSGILRLVAVLATAILVAPGWSQGYVIPLLLPVVLAAVRARPSFEDGDRAIRHLLALAVGFSVVVLPWMLPLVFELGVGGVMRDVLLLDGGVVEAYLLPFEAPAWPTVVLAVGAVAAYLARKQAAFLPAIVAVTLVAVAVVAYPMGARLAAENALLWLGPLVIVLGLFDEEALETWPRERAALVFLSIYSLQLFPRPDSVHVAMGAAPLALGGALVWRRFARRWRAAAGENEFRVGWVPRLAMAAAVVLALGRAAPAWVPRMTEPTVALALGPRAPVDIVTRHADHYERLVDLVGEVRDRSAPTEAIFAFPDLAGLGFLAARVQPYHYLYFVPGRPDLSGEERALRRLGEVSPSLVVTCPPQVPAFAGSTDYFARLGAAIERAYAPAAEVDGCVLRTRRPD